MTDRPARPAVSRPDPAAPRPPASPGYGSAAKAFHWTIVVLVLAQFVDALLMPDIGGDTPLDTTINVHFSIGIIILVLMALRLLNRLRHPVPLDQRDSPAWERGLARATHLIFYAILLVGPFLGWASASAHGLPVRLFGLIALPALAENKAHWGHVAGDVHMLGMWVLLGLIALHAAAALFHHFGRHDNVLRRMLPAK